MTNSSVIVHYELCYNEVLTFETVDEILYIPIIISVTWYTVPFLWQTYTEVQQFFNFYHIVCTLNS